MKKDLQKATETLLNVLKDRHKEVICRRFGIGCKRDNLQRIGDDYFCTRERIRQIEVEAIEFIRNSDVFKKENKKILAKLKKVVDNHGGIVEEKVLFEKILENDESYYPHLKLLLKLSDDLKYQKQTEGLNNYWFSSHAAAKIIEKTLHNLHDKVEKMGVMDENQIFEIFSKEFSKLAYNKIPFDAKQAKHWLRLSRKIKKNCIDEWGHISCSSISLSNINGYIKLILGNRDEPMHFKDIAKEISKLSPKKVSVASVHNELILGDEFVLLGRGVYDLSENVKYCGTLKEVVAQIVKEAGKIKADKLILLIQKERNLKEATIIRLLSDKKKYNRSKEGYYTLKRG